LVFACDFMTQYTALFYVVDVFIVIEISTRRVAHFNLTTDDEPNARLGEEPDSRYRCV
jgi:hypothetical protein